MDHPSLEQIWQAILGEAELTMSKASFTTWFKNSFIAEHQNGVLTIGVPNGFTRAWFENKFNTITFKQVRFLLDILAELVFLCLFSF